jgi:hypothetical protein
VLCKNSNEHTIQSFNSEVFVAESGLIAEHFSRGFRHANFLIIKEANKPLPDYTNAGRSALTDGPAFAAGVNSNRRARLARLDRAMLRLDLI